MSDSHHSKHIVVCRLGQMAYEPAWSLQRDIQQALIQAKRENPPRIVPHVVLLVEHPPVYTLGKSGDEANLLADSTLLESRGATFHRVDRGGDITYHGPGQLVGYPILDLDRFSTDIHLYLRNLEETIIRTCRTYGLVTDRVEGRTGVWVVADRAGAERKICAMGIRCSRWVTMHGFALNVNTDLSHFDAIVPCGITDRGVTSLSRETGRDIDMDAVSNELAGHLEHVFQASVEWLDREDSEAYLAAFLGTPIPA